MMRLSLLVAFFASFLSTLNVRGATISTKYDFYDNRDDFLNAIDNYPYTRSHVACTEETTHGHLPYTDGDLTIDSNNTSLMQIKESDSNFCNVPVYEIDVGSVDSNKGFFFDNQYPIFAIGFDMNHWAAGVGDVEVAVKNGNEIIGVYDTPDGHQGSPSMFYGFVDKDFDAFDYFQIGSPNDGETLKLRVTNFQYSILPVNEAPIDETELGDGCSNYNPDCDDTDDETGLCES